MNEFVTRPSLTVHSLSNRSILYLVLTNQESLIENISTRPGSFDSDHIPVTFTIKKNFNMLKNVARMVYSYGKDYFDGLRRSLSCIP